MSLPGNGIFVVQGEMAMLVTAMRRSTRWGSHSFPNEEYEVLMRTFQDLRTILNQVEDLKTLDPATYLSPFLEVIRSKETTGPVTTLALSAIHKFLSYGLIEPTHPSVPATVEDIADAVTHARFVGTDHSSDGVVLMKILQVLRTLMLSPEGAMLTDESVCEIMLSCFRICFETRLTELLRRNAEQCLRDMTQLIFMRLPQFPPEAAGAAFSTPGLSLKKRDRASKRRDKSTNSLDRKSPVTDPVATLPVDVDDVSKSDALTNSNNPDSRLINEAEITIEPLECPASPHKEHGRHSSMDLASGNTSITQLLEKCVGAETNEAEAELDVPAVEQEAESPMPETEPNNSTAPVLDTTPILETTTAPDTETDGAKPTKLPVEVDQLSEYVNHRGIRFTPQEDSAKLQPYGLVCVRELFRFLISLCNPLDPGNTSGMVHLGLCLVGTALEVGGDNICDYPSLLELVKDPLCRNLTSLLSTERISIFALDLQISFLLFEALRYHLKFQMEAFLKKIIEIIATDTTKAIYELKEIHHLALEYLAQIFRIPSLCTELYLNYDCDVYSMNVFEELTKLLSKNVVSSTAYNIHQLSLEALMTVVEAVEGGSGQGKGDDSTDNRPANEDAAHPPPPAEHVSLELGGLDDDVTSVAHTATYQGCGGRRRRKDRPEHKEPDIDYNRTVKKWITQGTELFNQKPERGIEYLQQHGVLSTPLDPRQVALFLRENPALDKKCIGEYICKRSNLECEGPTILGAFADSFDFTGLRIDQALRLYLETFRLPGEAPLIFLVMERFAERWHLSNGEPFANTDAAFRLAYAVIMLNMDQHNQNSKKLNVPMTAEDFVKNLRGCNGSGDFEQGMLEAVFHSIKNEEMIMPAERVGPVRDAYLWRVLQRRGATPAGRYVAASPSNGHCARLFDVACPPIVTALSAAFERASPPTLEEMEHNNVRDSPALYSLQGLERCAALVSQLPTNKDGLSLDSLLLTLCKFSGLLAPQHTNYIAIGVTLGQSTKAQCALRRACAVAARHADNVRDAWRHLLEIVNTLYIGRLLPKVLVEAEDYLSPSGTVSLIREASRGNDSGLLSSLYSYIALGESGVRMPSPNEKLLIELATDTVAKCNLPGLLVQETKFLHLDCLKELVRAMIAVGTPPDADSLQLNPQLEDNMIFFLELLGQTLIQNRDRALEVWDEAGAHVRRVVFFAASRSSHDCNAISRTLTALLRTSARLMRSEHCASRVLAHLQLLFELPYKLFYQQAELISCGLYELVKTSAQNVHLAADWDVVFALLCAGAGAWPSSGARGDVSPSSRSEGSDDECDRRPTSVSSESELSHSPHTQGWILVKPDPTSPSGGPADVCDVPLRPHRVGALARCCEALALVVRDVAHVTPYNCGAAVRAVRVAAKATKHGGRKPKSQSGRKSRPGSGRRRHDDSSDEDDGNTDQYHQISIQLLDLMHTLHSRTAQIFRWWREEADHGQAEEYDLWQVAWMPLLQGIAQFCTDSRKQVCNSAVAYLQRALLAPGLAAMGGAGWESCFTRVLFPLMEQLYNKEQAARADTIMCKVFLHHLSALSSRDTFPSLWLRVLAVQRSLVQVGDEPLTEAAVESLKNMILVMDSVKIFSGPDGYTELWHLTWEKIAEFQPNLKEELFPQDVDTSRPPAHVPPPPASPPTVLPAPPLQPPPPPPSGHAGAVSGMVPIRNPLYAGGGLTSSVLLQPLNEMISTSIGTSMTSPMPILYPGQPTQIIQPPTQLIQPQQLIQPPTQHIQPPTHLIQPPTQLMQPPTQLIQPPTQLIQPPTQHIQPPTQHIQPQQLIRTAPQFEPKPNAGETTPVTILDLDENVISPDKPELCEIYSEYLNNPYNAVKKTTLYDPEEARSPENQALTTNLEALRNPSLDMDKHKSYSADTSPMHGNKAQFGSSDNLAKPSSVFNFSSYFGVGELHPGSEVFDNLMSTQEG